MTDIWNVTSQRLPIRFWGTAEEWDGLGDLCQKQFRNAANHPLAVGYVCGMPDAHAGYGLPIGGVFPTLDGIVPYALGPDIGCGVLSVRTNLEASSLSRETLQAMRLALHDQIPVGDQRRSVGTPLPTTLADTDGLFVCSQPLFQENARMQMGTLGAGNHFWEIQADDQDRVWIMIHSGSRGAGAAVCKHYHAIAKRLMKTFNTLMSPEDQAADLSFIPASLAEYQQYWDEMTYCMTYAEANRSEMLNRGVSALQHVLKHPLELYDQSSCMHNFAAVERHFGKNVVIHRKGAIKAVGIVSIPGSMGTSSYRCRGLENHQSLNTCAHGAGRAMGRKEANRTITHDEAVASMGDVVFGVRTGDYEEMPAAYKNIERVMEAQSDLVTPIVKLRPLAVIKG